jgi:predicted small secreted protein
MKFLFVMVAVMTLNSCNTLIGITRDTKLGYQWTKSKIEGATAPADNDGAPVY